MATKTLKSDSVIKTPDESKSKYYTTETDWRAQTGFSISDVTSTEIELHLKNATEKIKKDFFYMTRFELVTKDSNGRYFIRHRYLANRYGADADQQTQIIHGEISKYDIQVFEVDSTSSVASAFALQGTRRNRLIYNIPYDGITEINALNCFFKLSSDYPTVATRQIYISYWIAGKPLSEISYELAQACIEYVTVLALQKIKTKRLRLGTVSFSMGNKTIHRSENDFDDMIKGHMDKYYSWGNWFKPFIGRKMKIGRRETFPRGQFLQRN